MMSDFRATPSVFPASLRSGVVRLAVLALCAGPLAACSSIDKLNPFGGEKYETKLLPDVPAEEIYDQGLARLAKNDGEGASKKFAELEKQYPYSQWARKGLLMQVYSEYEGGKYDDAAATGVRYVGLYPSSPEAAYATYLVAMSYYKQIPEISRDQESAEKALQAFTALVQKYPKSEYVEDAKFKIQVTRDQLAGKEMSVGRYYLARKNWPSTRRRVIPKKRSIV
jgi:outer membrane protein assembly factor BamD